MSFVLLEILWRSNSIFVEDIVKISDQESFAKAVTIDADFCCSTWKIFACFQLISSVSIFKRVFLHFNSFNSMC